MVERLDVLMNDFRDLMIDYVMLDALMLDAEGPPDLSDK